jgi:hypothetical protein
MNLIKLIQDKTDFGQTGLNSAKIVFAVGLSGANFNWFQTRYPYLASPRQRYVFVFGSFPVRMSETPVLKYFSVSPESTILNRISHAGFFHMPSSSSLANHAAFDTV